MSAHLTAIIIPKWGLAMEEGKITAWYVKEGDSISAGQDLVDIETSKIANTVESPAAGSVGRIVAQPNETLPVGALLAVLTDGGASDAEIDAFVSGFAITEAAADAAVAAEPITIEVSGRKARYLKTGPEDTTNLPILLLHGFYGDLESWMFVRDRLPADRTVYALDLPGHGGSGKDVGTGALSIFADAVLGFMDALGITKAHLVGHSMGGAVALSLAGQNADRVASVTSVASAGYGVPVNRAFVDGILKSSRARDFRPAAEMLFADPSLVNRDFLENLAKVKRLDGVQTALNRIAEATLFAPDTDTVAARVTAGVPVLAIIGERDLVIPPPADPGVPSLRLPVGHMAHMEAPAEVGGAITKLLATLP